MTRLAVLADIHGNLPALEAVIADMAQFEVDQVIVAGDSINWGPFSAQVLERILHANWAVMRGNHEFYMLYYNTPFAPDNWRGFSTLRWLNQSIPKPLRNAVSCLPDELRLCFGDAPFVRVVHGSPPNNHWQGIYPTQTSDDQVMTMLGGVAENTVIAAHTHLRMERHVGDWHIINPGSVGLPLDGVHGARYMLLDGSTAGWTPTFRLVPYDLAPLLAECERLDYVQQLGITGRIMIEEFRTARPLVYAFNQWRRKYRADAPDSLALVDEFLETDAVLEFRMPDYRT